TRVQPVEQGCADTPDVQEAGGTGSEADPNVHRAGTLAERGSVAQARPYFGMAKATEAVRFDASTRVLSQWMTWAPATSRTMPPSGTTRSTTAGRGTEKPTA